MSSRILACTAFVVCFSTAAFAQTGSSAQPEQKPAAQILAAQILIDGQPAAIQVPVVSQKDGEPQVIKLVPVISVEIVGDKINFRTESGDEAGKSEQSSATARAAVVTATPFSVITVLAPVKGPATEVFCPASNPVLVTASCTLDSLQIYWGKTDSQPPGSPGGSSWSHWLVPNSSAATGVHCAFPSGLINSQARLRCASR